MSSAAVILSISVLVMAFKGFKRLEANVGQVKIVAEQVNKAVNNVGPNEPTLRSIVNGMSHKLEAHVDDTDLRLTRIENEIGLLRKPTPRTRAK